MSEATATAPAPDTVPADVTPPAPADTAAPPADAPRAKRARKPLDEAGRARAAERNEARKLRREVEAATSEADFWRKVEKLRAKKDGRAPAEPAAPPAAPQATPEAPPPDPLAVPVWPGWVTRRQVEESRELAAGAVAALEKACKGTRYDFSASVKLGELKLSRAGALADVLAPLVAQLRAELLDGGKVEVHPVAAAAFVAAVVFGPPAASHAWEKWGPGVKAWWAEKRGEAPPAPPVRPAAPAQAPQVVQVHDFRKGKGA